MIVQKVFAAAHSYRIKLTSFSVENRARPPARYRVKNDVGGQIRRPARPAGWVTFINREDLNVKSVCGRATFWQAGQVMKVTRPADGQ